MDTQITGEEQAKRAAGGRFARGESGNPSGRPKGSKNRTTQACHDLLSADAVEIMARLIKDAKKGEPIALKLCVERLVPVRGIRDRVVDVELPEVARARDLIDAAAAVVRHTAEGSLSLGDAKEFMALLEVERKMIETTELAVRIEALEGSAAEAAVADKLAEVAPDLRARVRFLDPERRGR